MSAVTVCIPAYKAEAFIDRTIKSVLTQTYPDVQVLVSVDPGNDDTARVVARYEAHGVRVVEQPRRLGWVGNINAALALADTPHVMILPHDDEIDPTYVAACMAALEAHPDAVLAYSDLRFGAFVRMRQASVQGELADRMYNYVSGHFDAVAFRGVFDRARAQRHAVPDFAIGDYAADTLWVARMLAQGGMVRVPQVLYRKHLRASSVHAGWKRATASELDEKWIVHCFELERTVREAVAWDAALEAAWERRLRQRLNQSRWRRRSTSPLDPNVPLRPQASDLLARLQDRAQGAAAGR